MRASLDEFYPSHRLDFPVVYFLCSYAAFTKPQSSFDIGLHRVWIFFGSKALDGASFFVDEKFGEVPFDGVDESSALSFL